MPSFKATAAVVATALLSLGAQAQYVINVTAVPLATRDYWCQSQLTSCPLLCLQLPGASSTVSANDCDPTTLDFDCVCGNGLSPNASEFSQTIPYFVCTEYGTECVAACDGDNTCQSNCRTENPCGAQNPVRVNATTTTSSATASGTSTGGVAYNGLGGSSATSTSSSSNKKSGSEAALDIGRSYGLAIVFTSLFAGFAVVM